MVLALSIGEGGMTDLVKVLLGNGSRVEDLIIFDVRLPRVLMAFLIGTLLAQTGLITQNVFSNPIADPFIVGIVQVATFGAVIAYFLGLDDGLFGIMGFAFSAIFSLFLFRISSFISLSTLLIIGIAVSSFMGAFTSFATYVIGERSFVIVAWLMGYIGLSSWDKLLWLFIAFVVSLSYFFVKRHELNILLCGEDEAKNMGVDAVKLKSRLLVISSLAVAFSVAFTGIIGFVGLMIPHISRLVSKSFDNAEILPLCGIIGGNFLLFCDTLARSLLSPIEIPVGVVTAFFGAPFFVYLALSVAKS